MGSLDNKVAVITGASSGIGEATARVLANEGAAVVLAARRKERLEDLKSELEGNGGKALVVETDVTKREDTQNLIQQAKDAFGSVDILVNNAGVMLLSFVEKLKLDEWEQMVDVNVKGLMFATAAALPTMMEQEGGHIVNISSVAGRKVMQSGAVYCATKFAVTAFSEGLRQELAPNKHIRVTSIEPGAVETELTEHITDEDALEGMKGMMNMTMLESEDIAQSILYAVASPSRVNVNEILILPTEQA